MIGEGEMDLRDMTVAPVETIDAVFRAQKDLQEFGKAKMMQEEILRQVHAWKETLETGLSERLLPDRGDCYAFYSDVE